MFPRSGSIESDGSRASSWARRRTDAVPIRILGRISPAPHSASRASSRARYAPTTRPSASVEVMSFAEWTATSIRPSRSASSSSFTNTPRSPICPKGFVRSRSPAVVIGTSAISMPGPRSRSQASSACVSASLLPRLPTLRSTVVVTEAEEVAGNLDVPRALGGRRLLHAHDRHVEELVDDLRRQRLDGSPLAFGQALETALCLGQLAGADRLGPLAERRDRRHDVARRLPVAEPPGLVGRDRLCPLGFAPPAAHALTHDRLQVVDVIEVAVVERGDLGIDVTRHREVDHEQRPALAIRNLVPGEDLIG